MYIKEIPCCVCGTMVGKGYDGSDKEHTNIPYQDWEGCDVKIAGGFSSDFDMTELHGVMCNACVKNMLPRLYEVELVSKQPNIYHYKKPGLGAASVNG
jgi:hypothetical protein